MEGVSLNSNLAEVIQASVSQSQARNNYDVAIAERAQDVQKQQGAAAVQLIEASLSLIDVRA